MDDKIEEHYPNGNLKSTVPSKDGIRHGHMKMYYETGELMYQGEWENGNQEGVWKLYYENGKLKRENLFKNNEKISFKEWDEEGKEKLIINSKECTYQHKNGHFIDLEYLNGPHIIFHKEIPFTGIWIDFNDNKTKNLEKEVSNGIDHGKYTEFYNENDQIFETGNKINGKKDGLWCIYYKNGQIRNEHLYDHNTTECSSKMYDNNGTLREKGKLSCKNNFEGRSFFKNGIDEVYDEDGKFIENKYYIHGLKKSKSSYEESLSNEEKLKKDIKKGRNFTIETNKEIKKIINKFKDTEVSDINIDIKLKKECCYSETEFYGEHEGHNYTIKGKIHGKWFETEYWWDEDRSLKSFIETVGDLEITELDKQLSYGKLDTDVSNYEGDSIEWSDETPQDIVNKFKDDYDSLMYDNNDVDQDELLFYEPTNNISLIKISFKDSQDNQIKIDWSNKNIT